MEENIKREIIMENYMHPYNNELVENKEYIKVNTNNESCIDNIDLQVLIKDDKIADIKFTGEACAISTASTSIMIKELIGKDIKSAINFIEQFENMVNEEEYNRQKLNTALVFDDIFKQNNRKTCATLPYKGIKKVLEDILKNK